MSVGKSLSNLASLSVSHVALNPVVTASLLWVLTKGPANIRGRLVETISSLRDPQIRARVIRTLKWLLALGLAGSVNKRLNQLALNSWRVKSEKKRWKWNEEIAVVTGGCSGIGELVVKRLINRGVKVAVLDIQQLPHGLQGYSHIKFFACDITDPTAVIRAAKEIKTTLGSPSILVNNAGIVRAQTILDAEPEHLRKIFAVNVLSNWYTTQAFLPDMIERNKGHIVTVASMASFIGVAGMADYAATKAAVLSFHEGLNQELRRKYHAPNILTTSVHPNWVQTPLLAPFEKSLKDIGEAILEPSYVANAIAKQIFKCSGTQLFLPPETARLSGLRGWPSWAQDSVRGSVAKVVLPSVK